MKPFIAFVVGLIFVLGTLSSTRAGESKPRYEAMDYGPFLSASLVTWPTAEFDNGPGSFTGDSTARGIAIRLSEKWESGVIFDADLMRISAGWTGGALNFRGLIGDGAHGWDPMPTVAPTFLTPHLPGWADAHGSFKDPRPSNLEPLPPAGPLPRNVAHYNGLYRYGNQVILSYSIGKTGVLECAGLETHADAKAFALTYQVESCATGTLLMIADGRPEIPGTKKTSDVPTKTVEGNTAELDKLHIALINPIPGSKLEFNQADQLILRIPPHRRAGTFKILIGGGGSDTTEAFSRLWKTSPKPADLSPLTRGGPSQWNATIQTRGLPGKSDKAYVVDQITIPYENPYKSWMRIGGFDFFSDGTRAALSTWSGDVWIVSGLDDKLEKLTWKRFATGLHQPLGLKIVNDVIYTVGHDQITRLVDLNGDGEADFYENFNNDWQLTTAFHAFCFDLHTDPKGNFIFGFGSPVHAGGGGFQKITADHGCIIKVSKDGKKMEHYATGLRAPNGMTVGTDGQVTIADNEGTWVPTSPLHWVKPGDFLGVCDSAHGAKIQQPKPLCWISKKAGADNSSGGQTFVTSDKWGPFQGYLLHESYGQSSLFLVLREEVKGQMQGGVVKFPLQFTSSTMRARFNPRDGQLYVSGLKGWQTNAAKDGGFDRVRYTGGPVRMPRELNVTEKGLKIGFTCPLDPALAQDVQNWNVEQWNYRWTSNYGSDEYSVVDSEKPGHDPVTVKSAKLLPDQKSVLLEIDGLRPVMQMRIKFNINTADGTALKYTIYNTIHKVGAAGSNSASK